MGRILVIDDDEDTLYFFEETLGVFGHEVTGAVSCFEALDFLRENRVELIILDLHMPDFSGLDFLACVSKSHSRVPIIICSGYPSLRDHYRVWSAHVASFISKPVEPQALAAEVDRVLAAAKGAQEGQA